MIKNCKHCNDPVEVNSTKVTVVMCDTCRVKKGFTPNEKRDFDTKDFIYCRECGSAKRRIDFHLKSEHGWTVEIYLEKHPDSPLLAENTTKKKRSRSAESRKKTSDALTKDWQKKESREKREKHLKENPYWKGKKFTPEHRVKLGRASGYRDSIKGKRRDINYPVRSIDEANFCRILDYMNIPYGYETAIFNLGDTSLMIDFDLYQDFEMFKKGTVELKGWIKEDGDFGNKEKFDLLKDKHPEEYDKIQFIFSGSSDWNILEEKYRPKIPMWESVKQNLKTHPELYAIAPEPDKREDWDEYVECPLCLRDGVGVIKSRNKFLTFKHLEGHGYTFEQFKKEFPNNKLKIDSIGKAHSEKLSGEGHFNFGKHHSDGTKRKISATLTKKSPT